MTAEAREEAIPAEEYLAAFQNSVSVLD